ncbi:DUF6440 domain-containing protein, partial [Dysosmobacter welbionis]
ANAPSAAGFFTACGTKKRLPAAAALQEPIHFASFTPIRQAAHTALWSESSSPAKRARAESGRAKP